MAEVFILKAPQSSTDWSPLVCFSMRRKKERQILLQWVKRVCFPLGLLVFCLHSGSFYKGSLFTVLYVAVIISLRICCSMCFLFMNIRYYINACKVVVSFVCHFSFVQLCAIREVKYKPGFNK